MPVFVLEDRHTTNLIPTTLEFPQIKTIFIFPTRFPTISREHGKPVARILGNLTQMEMSANLTYSSLYKSAAHFFLSGIDPSV